MTQTPKVFAQQYPAATVDTELFAVPLNTSAQFTVFICNQSSTEDAISIAIVPYDELTTSQYNYIAYNTRVIANGVLAFSGLFLGSQDQIRVISQGGTSSFTATGVSIT